MSLRTLRRFLNVPDDEGIEIVRSRAAKTYERLDKKRRLGLLKLLCECADNSLQEFELTFLLVPPMKSLLVSDIQEVGGYSLHIAILHAVLQPSSPHVAVGKEIMNRIASTTLDTIVDGTCKSKDFISSLTEIVIAKFPESSMQWAYSELDRLCCYLRLDGTSSRKPGLTFPTAILPQSEVLFASIFSCLGCNGSPPKANEIIEFLLEYRPGFHISQPLFSSLLLYSSQHDLQFQEDLKFWLFDKLESVDRSNACQGFLALIALSMASKATLSQFSSWMKETLPNLNRRSQQLVESLLDELYDIVPVEMKMCTVSILEALPREQWADAMKIYTARLKSDDLIKEKLHSKFSGPNPADIVEEFNRTNEIPRNFFRDILLNDRWFKSDFLPYLVDRRPSNDLDARKAFYTILKEGGRVPRAFQVSNDHFSEKVETKGDVDGLRNFLKENIKISEASDDDAFREIRKIKKYLAALPFWESLSRKCGSILVNFDGNFKFLNAELLRDDMEVSFELLRWMSTVDADRSDVLWRELVSILGDGSSALFYSSLVHLLRLTYGKDAIGPNLCKVIAKLVILIGTAEAPTFFNQDGLKLDFIEGFFYRRFVRRGAQHTELITRNFVVLVEADHRSSDSLRDFLQRMRFHLQLSDFDSNNYPFHAMALAWPEGKETTFKNFLFYEMTYIDESPAFFESFRRKVMLMVNDLGWILAVQRLFAGLIEFTAVFSSHPAQSTFDPYPLERNTAAFGLGCSLLVECIDRMWDEVSYQALPPDDLIVTSQWFYNGTSGFSIDQWRAWVDVLVFLPTSICWTGKLPPCVASEDTLKHVIQQSAERMNLLAQKFVASRVVSVRSVAAILFEGACQYIPRLGTRALAELLISSAPNICSLALMDCLRVSEDVQFHCLSLSQKTPNQKDFASLLLSIWDQFILKGDSPEVVADALVYRSLSCFYPHSEDWEELMRNGTLNLMSLIKNMVPSYKRRKVEGIDGNDTTAVKSNAEIIGLSMEKVAESAMKRIDEVEALEFEYSILKNANLSKLSLEENLLKSLLKR
ncbi:hypothetical protein HDU97_008584 [Phlyctochytrium planicorne]|nr:hypothetical protein HDU97_008584 [Phlyctochytrium planicorne]